MTKQFYPGSILLSRTDNIGDVVLTLPMAAAIRQYYPHTTIAFMGTKYTQPVIEDCQYIDVFVDKEDFLHKKVTINGQLPDVIVHVLPEPSLAFRAMQLNIPLRIGTKNRFYHWPTCNKLVALSRKHSLLHEAQLNMQLLEPLGINTQYSLETLGNMFGLNKLEPLAAPYQAWLREDKYNIVLHPKSQGHGREWQLERYIQLINTLDSDQFNILISGTEKERLLLQPLFDAVGEKVTDTTGQLTLQQFMSFISHCDGLLASGTGPLHLAAALGKDAFGIFPPVRPVHPGRWRPLGKGAKVFVANKSCMACQQQPLNCVCVKEIKAEEIKMALEQKRTVTKHLSVSAE